MAYLSWRHILQNWIYVEVYILMCVSLHDFMDMKFLSSDLFTLSFSLLNSK